MKLREHLDKISSDISSIRVDIAKQTVSWKHHVKRTDLLEKDLKPVKKHVDFVNMLAKLIVGLAAIAGAFKWFISGA